MNTINQIKTSLNRQTDLTNELLDKCDVVIGCFEAAMGEGLMEALAETTDMRLKDLVERRLMYALYAMNE